MMDICSGLIVGGDPVSYDLVFLTWHDNLPLLLCHCYVNFLCVKGSWNSNLYCKELNVHITRKVLRYCGPSKLMFYILYSLRYNNLIAPKCPKATVRNDLATKSYIFISCWSERNKLEDLANLVVTANFHLNLLLSNRIRGGINFR